MAKTPVYYFDWLKEQYPDTLKYALYSNNIELYYGNEDFKDLRLTKTYGATGITKTQDFSSGGVIREYDVEIQGFIDHHKIEFSPYHIPFNNINAFSCKYSSCKSIFSPYKTKL